MSKVIARASEDAAFGGFFGTVVGTILAGTVLALPGINIVLAPFVAAAAVTSATVSCGAVGTVIGGVGGAVSGAAEESKERHENPIGGESK